jgi:hypothetical protein
MKSKAVAEALELTPEHYSRCESGEKTMALTTEKAYRAFAFVSSLLRDQMVQEVLKAGKAQKAIKAISAIREVFMKVKIVPVADAADELSFSFSRRNCSEKPCGNDDEPEWEQKVEPAKAA